MASREINRLTTETSALAQVVIDICKGENVDLLVCCTLRTLEEQAILYRQSRSYGVIKMKMEDLNKKGFSFLADIIASVGPRNGAHVTNAAPGESWHNYGEAFDAVPIVGGKPMWEYKGNERLWNTYGDVVRQVGANWAGEWRKFKELPHTQLRSSINPLCEYNPQEVYRILRNNNLL